ncbi:MAG: sugar phosphate isomerase/epimerase [Chloroflexota bacterium]|nr:sugar phosphate isomerase/epimerase [Chloroflexota bacterium]
MTELKLAVQDFLLPGATFEEQFENARAYGYDAVEIAIRPESDLATVARDVGTASKSTGVPVAALCTARVHDPLQEEPTLRRERFAGLTNLLALADELGANGVVSVPIRPSRGFASKAALDAWVDDFTRQAVAEFGAWAATLPDGRSAVFLEPLNRFEATFLRTVGHAADIARRVGHPRVRTLADLFHMNIEEADMAKPIREAGSWLGHVHTADNNRLEPGAGALDPHPTFAALQEIGYEGYVSVECFSPGGPVLSGPHEIVLPKSATWMRERWAEAGSLSTN